MPDIAPGPERETNKGEEIKLPGAKQPGQTL